MIIFLTTPIKIVIVFISNETTQTKRFERYENAIPQIRDINKIDDWKMIMKNVKKTVAVESKTETTAKKLTIADVARELKLNEKRARSTLRKNPKIYNAFQKQRFDKNSKQHDAARAALKQLFKIA